MSTRKFEKILTVDESHLDDLNHVNNVVYVQWVQDIAAAHWDVIAPDEFSDKFMWVVLRHDIEYKRAALLGNKVLMRTWVESVEGVRSDRCVEILNADTGVLFCKAKTTWCLLDKSTQRPKRIEEEIELALKK